MKYLDNAIGASFIPASVWALMAGVHLGLQSPWYWCVPLGLIAAYRQFRE